MKNSTQLWPHATTHPVHEAELSTHDFIIIRMDVKQMPKKRVRRERGDVSSANVVPGGVDKGTLLLERRLHHHGHSSLPQGAAEGQVGVSFSVDRKGVSVRVPHALEDVVANGVHAPDAGGVPVAAGDEDRIG